MPNNGKNLYELKEAKTALLLNHPFFASLMMDMLSIVVLTEEDGFIAHTAQGSSPIPTLGTDGKHIFINEDFFVNKLSLDNRIAALAHEIGHAMFMHLSRGKQFIDLGFDGNKFIPMLYNVAGDYVINDMLEVCKVGILGSGWLHDPSIATHKDHVDEVYRKLYAQLPPEQKPQEGEGDGEGEGEDGEGAEGNSTGNGGGSGKETGGIPENQDTHIYTPQQAATSEAQWKRAMRSAANGAKAVGKLPGSMESIIEDFMEPKITWAQKLRMSVEVKANKDDTTSKRFNRRRYIQTGLVFPARTGHGAGHVVVALDTSGSVSDLELRQFFGELASILTDCNPERLTYIETDSRVQRTEEVENATELATIASSVKGRGGTAFQPTFDWVDENMDTRPDMLIYFTDMGCYDSPDAPGYPVIWASTVDGHEEQFNYGSFIYIDVRDNG